MQNKTGNGKRIFAACVLFFAGISGIMAMPAPAYAENVPAAEPADEEMLAAECEEPESYVYTDLYGTWTFQLAAEEESDEQYAILTGVTEIQYKNDNELVIPETVKSDKDIFSTSYYQVKALGENFLKGNRVVKKIRFQEGCKIDTIGKSVFYACTSLREITIPDGVSTIPERAFEGCIRLESVQLTEKVTAIEPNAFEDCESLTEVRNMQNLETMGYRAFYGCTSLREIKLGEMTKLNKIGYDCFYSCKALEEVDIPASMYGKDNNFGNGVFSACSGLKSVRFAEGSKDLYLGNRIFQKCSSLENVKLPPTLVKIGDNAFDECKKLGSLDLSACSKLNVIGDSAFIRCRALNKILLPESVKTIWEDAFNSCTALEEIGLPANVETVGERAFAYCSALKSVTLSPKMTAIPKACFGNCIRLETVRFPDMESNMTVGDSAFSGCTMLEKITLPANVQSVGASAFKNCSALTEVDLGNCLTTLEENTFDGCKSLKELALPDTLCQVNARAFSKCESLTGVTLPQGMTELGQRTFYNCKSMESLVLPESLETIGEGALSGMDSLKSLVIPASVTAIDAKAFSYQFSTDSSGLKSLESIHVVSENTVYSDQGADCLIHTESKKLLLACKNTKIPEGVETIGAYAFRGCRGLYELTLPQSVVTVEKDAFEGLNLYTLTLGKKLTSFLADDAGGCTHLKRVILQGTERLDENAFGSCMDIDTIYISKTTGQICPSAFWNELSCQVYFEGSKEEWQERISAGEQQSFAGRMIYFNSSMADLYETPDLSVNPAEPFEPSDPSAPSDPNAPGGTVSGNDSGGNQTGGQGTVSANTPGGEQPGAPDKADKKPESGEQEQPSAPIKAVAKKKGSRFMSADKKLIYQVTDDGSKPKVTLVKAKAGLKNLTVPDTVQDENKVVYQVTLVGAKLCKGNKKLTKLTIGKNVTKIGEKAFYQCISLKSVTIGASVKTIEKNAFCDCKKLKTITVKSQKLKKVGKKAFSGLPAKAKVKAPKKKLKAYRKLLKKGGFRGRVAAK